MDTIITEIEARRISAEIETQMSKRSATPTPKKPGLKTWGASLAILGLVAGGVIFGPELVAPETMSAASATPPSVDVSTPVQQELAQRLEFLGQFSPVQQVGLRAQVGGTLIQIGFKDGDIVHKGDLLFEIDPTPYQIKMSEAVAQLQSAQARVDLANRELARADTLKQTGAGTVEVADQRSAELRSAQAALDEALATVRDAKFDLDHTRITAPFTGRMGSHLVSVGNLIAGSRAGSSPTTLLATIVSTGSVYLNFDMSEADYMTFLRHRLTQSGPLAEKVKIELADEDKFTHEGALDFIDNTLDRSSGTIHARATVPNTGGLLTPGGFARVRVDVSPPAMVMLVPDASVLPDQSNHIVLTVSAQGVVTPRVVEIGGLRDGLRVIRSGLQPSDRVIVNGIPTVRPGLTVVPHSESLRLASNQA